MIEYYNYLTTPSGNSFNIKELTNKDFLILLKFLNGENFKGFYQALDSLISQSIPSFNELDICDKLYIYIAFYYYSVRSSISIKSEKFDSVEVPLNIMLDSIEEQYNNEKLDIKINDRNIKIHYPRTLIFDDNNQILVDILSAIREIEGLKISIDNIAELRKAMPIKMINDIEYKIKQNFNLNVDIVKDVMGAANIQESILNGGIYFSIAYIYKDSLDNFYNMQYLLCHYIRVDWQSLLSMTPVETTILYKNFIEDKERQNEKNKGKNMINTHDPNVADALLG
jgi:hypothetical protein